MFKFRQVLPVAGVSLIVALSSAGCSSSAPDPGEETSVSEEALGGALCTSLNPNYTYSYSFDVTTNPPYGLYPLCPDAVRIQVSNLFSRTNAVGLINTNSPSDCNSSWVQMVIYNSDNQVVYNSGVWHGKWLVGANMCLGPAVQADSPPGRIRTFKIYAGAGYHDSIVDQDFQLPIRVYTG